MPIRDKFSQYKGIQYALINDSGEGSSGEHPIQPRWPTKRTIITTALVLILIATAGTTYYLLVLPHQSHTSSEPIMNDCGKSSAEAMERGCKMEPLFYGWILPQCYYPELTVEYPVFTDRPWFRDEDLTQPVSVDELMTGRYSSI